MCTPDVTYIGRFLLVYFYKYNYVISIPSENVKPSRAKPSNSREMMEIVTREELWDIESKFYVNELIGYSSQIINKAKSLFLLIITVLYF